MSSGMASLRSPPSLCLRLPPTTCAMPRWPISASIRSKPAVEFEIRMPKETLAAASDTQIELHTDRNQTLALVEGVRELGDGRSVLRGAVPLNHRTADRVLVVNLPGKGTFEFRLRLPAEPHRSEQSGAQFGPQFGPWHLADRIASPLASPVAPQDAYTIRYRVL
ncbi:hypothetical protein ACVWXM_009215 [Bradyrhizobium sp. GM7.3]